MLKLYVKDNTDGHIHEYGTNKHDALILQDDGSLRYENMQSCVGTMFPEEGYSFCLEDGTVPKWDLEHGVEPYIDIGGEYYTKPQNNADRIRAMSDEELAEFLCNVYDEEEDCAKFINGYYFPCYDEYSIKEWLEQPAEEEKDEL